MIKKRRLQMFIEGELAEWFDQLKKEMKIKKDIDIARMGFSYLRESQPHELKIRMEKARISSMLQEVSAEAEEKLKQKEQLEKQLEKLEA